jgi:hypothetical protein
MLGTVELDLEIIQRVGCTKSAYQCMLASRIWLAASEARVLQRHTP